MINANILAAETNVTGKVFNIGGGNCISVRELIREIEINTEKKAKINYIQKQKGDVENAWADTKKAQQILGWKPTI